MSSLLKRSVALACAAAVLLSFATSSGIAAQELSSANGSAAQAGNNGRLARPDMEVVESAGKNIPNPLIPQRIESYLNETVTTSQAGRLLVTKSMELTMTCTPTSGVLYFLIVDDVPIRNSAVFSRTGFVGQISGATGNLDAGAHTIKIGQTCTVPGATPSGATVTIVGITSAIVLP